MGRNHLDPAPVALYGVVLLMAGIAYYILARALIAKHGQGSALALAMGRDTKGIVSVVIYAVAIPIAFANTWVACALYVFVAMMWLVPDRRIEHALEKNEP
jgi:uncharacterized membrane protein